MKFDDFSFSDAALEKELCLSWSLDAGSLTLFRQAATKLYRATRLGQPVFVKVIAESLRPERDVEGATAFLRHLTEKGAPVSGLVSREDGERYGFLDSGDASYFVCVLEDAPGEALTKDEDDPTKFRAWGDALAQLHNAADDFDGAPYPFLTGDGEWLRVKERLAEADEALGRRIAEIDAWRAALPHPHHVSSSSASAGFPITHGDMNAGNAVWDGQRVCLIDFEEPIYTWNAADIARPFRETSAMSDARRKVCFDAFLAGYKSHRTLQFYEPQDYSNFITVKNLEMLGWLTKVWTGETGFGGGSLQSDIDDLKAMILEPLRLG